VSAGAALARRWLALPARRTPVRLETRWLPAADGVRLATSLLLPRDGAGPWPAVLVRTAAPAHAPGHPSLLLGRLVAEMGHAVVIQECRGRYASEGSFTPFVSEQADGRAAIAWLAGQPFFDGRLALVGWGYAGFAAWAALAGSPVPVSALVAIFAARDPWTLLRPGGALALDLALRWGVGLGEREAVAPRRLDLERGLAHRPLREADRVTHRRVEWFRAWVDHPERDAFWRALAPALPEAPPPVLFVAGARHPALAGQLADLAALHARGGARPELVLGPWPGGQPRRARRTRSDPQAESLRATLDFLARRFSGAPPPRAPVRVFVSGAGAWREAADWPPPEAAPTAFYLRAAEPPGARARRLLRDAPAADEPPDAYACDPRDPVGSDDESAVHRDDVLCYRSAPLAEPLLLAGPVRAVLHVATSAAESDFTAGLAALAPTGAARLLCEGIARSRGASGAERRLEIDLAGVAASLEAGERLELRVSSSSFPRWDRPSHTDVAAGAAGEGELAPARQTVHHDRARPSHVLLPVVAAAGA
jgi:putative CocE/NonD family hydrolase